ncbi:hypothetical protein JQ557_17620 [Bradyrhizobium sp. U87765 SZCCT0131]|uniref:hypothetical protein n=1 Tax=unclassified Bradyrhizobium TaxID=2631580 RepID=UPI001BA9D4DC|nr:MULTISPECIES: hypothetical protein [unclassified Bradyrhizobium]MBR1219831.1 hypothetical protein [Bradyrhizobium sp. U87765 SZCCT0131]MBR1262482.1 hypothetical protein [Bradyrhizobium sp. U87765 SZCCT0134]MBR1308335.1 hypothetical protein [Bradyrhizobium sp. U87765 SZCCT0110]MBR1318264.1 hypothetical protein [Bradyrhizobium sp. U87765 SZCCT0109]MBR1351967.1 hypothetical protein [Bradyrhizobium sp. U87765 SZCCT0048]
MDTQFIGLLECPYRSGWIEFTYAEGDRVGTLKQSIEQHFGQLDESRFKYYGKSWTIFCQQVDGTYWALRNKDPIPTSPPNTAPEDISIALHDGIVWETSFVEEYWWLNFQKKKKAGFTFDPIANFGMHIDFKRNYELPERRIHAVTLLALVALGGG